MKLNPIHPGTSDQSDLLRYRPLYRLVTHCWFPGALQLAALVAFLLLIVVGWHGVSSETRYTNLSGHIVWVIWWPALVFSGFFAARAWCIVCPMGFVTKQLGRVGLQIKVPETIREHRIGIVLGLFLLHTIIVSYHVHHVPHLTSLYMLLLMGYGIAVSLLFEPDAFCGSFCPVNGIIGPYAMLSPTELRFKDRSACKDCTSNACKKICPRNLYMGSLDSSEEDCLLCFDCVKQCPESNIRFRLRQPLKGLWQDKHQTLANALLVTILLGIMIEEVGEEWELFEFYSTAVPRALTQLGIPETFLGYGWLTALWLNFLLPFLLLAVAAGAARQIAREGGILELLQRYALSFIPLIFSLHLGKLWHKFNTKIGLLPHSIVDPSGQQTAVDIAANNLPAPAPLMAASVEGAFLLLLLLIGVGGTLFAIRQTTRFAPKREPKRGVDVPFYGTALLLGLVFAIVIVNWFGMGF